MSSRDIQQSYYEVLEVSPAAPHHEIVKAYERAKSTYSPDSPALYTMFTKEEAEELRALIEEAYLILSNQAKRREYDEKLHASHKKTSTTDTLPDFPPHGEVAAPVKSSESSGKSETISVDRSGQLPDGFRRSRLSVYEVKSDVEDEIQNCKEYDGAFLRKIRLYKNINLDQMSKETRISRTYIAAVESNDREALPAPVFVRGFVIQIARVLGLEENLVASSYMEKFPKENS